MNTKLCVYKNCGNTSQTTDVTFFAFPLKDQHKCDAWAKLAGCEGINLKYRYLCENHFSSICISRTPRRTILLPRAMPYRWDEELHKNFDAESSITCEDEYISSDNERDKAGDEMLMGELTVGEELEYDTTDAIEQRTTLRLDTADTTTKTSAKTAASVPVNMNHDYENSKITQVVTLQNDRFCGVQSTPVVVCHVTKRQRMQPLSNNVIVETSTSPKTELDGFHEEVIDYTENNPEITTFIYKGEEYIQMPKRVYQQQRAKLDVDIERYEQILRSIKASVQHIE